MESSISQCLTTPCSEQAFSKHVLDQGKMTLLDPPATDDRKGAGAKAPRKPTGAHSPLGHTRPHWPYSASVT